MFSALVRPVVLTVASLVFLTSTGGFLGELSAEQHRSFVTHKVNRTGHPSGLSTLSRDSLVKIGGVLSQADSLTDSSGNPVSVRLELPPNRPYTGYVNVNVHRTGASMSPTSYRYPITYDDLVPMALFVDNGGTSVYTLWDSFSGRFPENFEREAGFVSHHVVNSLVRADGLVEIEDRVRGMIAFEFQRTRYSSAVHLLDICRGPGCVEAVDNDLVTRINAALNDVRSDETRVVDPIDVERIDETYLNTDLYLPFRVTINDNLMSVDGNVVRLHPTVDDQDHIVIDDVERIVTPDRYVASEVLLSDVDFLFETLALLRSAKESSPDDWQRFREALASEVLVNANPEPWRRYSLSFCSLYSEDEGCQDWR